MGVEGYKENLKADTKKTWIKKLPLSIFDEVVSWTETFRETVWRILSCLLAFYLLNLLGRNFRVLLISTNIFSLLSFDHGLVLSKYYWFLKTSSFFPYRERDRERQRERERQRDREREREGRNIYIL